MEDRQKINYSLIVTIVITLIGWAVNFGVLSQKIATNARDIEKLYTKQNNTDLWLQSINSNLVELNTKMEIFMKLNTKEDR